MKIVSTFVLNLYAVKYDDQEFDELERLFDAWGDIEFLENFFEAYKTDLAYFNIEVEDAIRRTRQEAKQLRESLLASEKYGEKLKIFVPLDDLAFRKIDLSKQKAKKYWLRLYAIKIDENYFLITGGAIKLTHTIQERLHTQLELEKLTKCRDFLIAKGVFDVDSLEDFLETTL